MKSSVFCAAAALAASGFLSNVHAADPKRGMDEAQEHGCLKCHDVEKKKVGPSYKEISAKMKGQKVEDAMAAMKEKPVHKSVLQKTKDSSLKEIIEWVMSL